MSDVHIFCWHCGSELKFLGKGSGLKFAVVPCKKCKDDEYFAGYNNGHQDGYTSRDMKTELSRKLKIS